MTTNGQKVVIVTGASRGIGAGVVEGYRKHGYAVVATSRSIAPSDDPQVHTVPEDLAEPGTADRVVDAALERFGRVDTLVNNAGMFLAKPFTAYTDDDSRRWSASTSPGSSASPGERSRRCSSRAPATWSP